MLKDLIQDFIFRYSKNYGSLTRETRIKDAVNMIDLTCLLATVRTLKQMYFHYIVYVFIAYVTPDTTKWTMLYIQHSRERNWPWRLTL